jgi:hypothetical protein
MIFSIDLTEHFPFLHWQQDFLMPVAPMSKGVWVWSLWHRLAFVFGSSSSLPASMLLLMTPLPGRLMAASGLQTRSFELHPCQSSIAHKKWNWLIICSSMMGASCDMLP